nr:reverse transcriptase domain-containing protein [Tanacetum cinerariifolium]
MQRSSGSGSLPSNTIANLRGDLKAIITRSGVAYDGPTIPPIPSPLSKEVEREPEVTKTRCKLQVQNVPHMSNGKASQPSDPSTESDVEIIDPILEKFIQKHDIDYSPLPGDEDDDLFDLMSNNNEWKKLFNSTLPEESSESSEIATLSSSPFGNEDK